MTNNDTLEILTPNSDRLLRTSDHINQVRQILQFKSEWNTFRAELRHIFDLDKTQHFFKKY